MQLHPREQGGCRAPACWQTHASALLLRAASPGLSELLHYLVQRPGQLFPAGCLVLGRGCAAWPLAQPQLAGHAGLVQEPAWSWFAGRLLARSLEHGRAQRNPWVRAAALGWARLHGCCSDVCVRATRQHQGTAGTSTCRAGVRDAADLSLLLRCWSKVSRIPASSVKQKEAFQQGTLTLHTCGGKAKHIGLVGAQAQPGWSSTPSGLKLMGPVKDNEERFRQ